MATGLSTAAGRAQLFQHEMLQHPAVFPYCVFVNVSMLATASLLFSFFFYVVTRFSKALWHHTTLNNTYENKRVREKVLLCATGPYLGLH